MTTFFALFASIIRTIVPVIVGTILSWLLTLGIPVDGELRTALAAALTLSLTAIYYVVVRLLETYVTPKLGWLLGLAKSPTSYTAESPAVSIK